MVIVMDMGTGKRQDGLEEAYGDEVLLSNWLPRPEPGLGLQEVQAHHDAPPEDADAFLRAVYLSQE
ncbi:MAG: hypothetical protein AB1768_05375 [Pseudomonadota bacterium]|jgi:hypothetical protein